VDVVGACLTEVHGRFEHLNAAEIDGRGPGVQGGSGSKSHKSYQCAFIAHKTQI